MIGPAADALWASVQTVSTADGFEEKGPETDEEWQNLRHSATAMVEAANLMLIPGRTVASAETRSNTPGVELEPDQIALLIAQDQVTWAKLAADLQASGQLYLNAIDTRNPNPLFDAGDNLNTACENCHQRYWYPSSSQQ